MDSLTFTISTKDLKSAGFEQLVSDIQLFLNILLRANPDYIEAGDILQKQLDEQVKKHKEELSELSDPRTPKEIMREKFCDIFDEANLGCTAYAMNEHHGSEAMGPMCYAAWDNFLQRIGETMGPMCYAAWTLSTVFHHAGLNTDWINACVSYYENNWEF